MVVLVTAISLQKRDGSTLYARDLALELVRVGHRPIVYSPLTGVVADQLVAGGVEVIERLTDLPARPEVIHGNHTVESTEAVLRLPGVPLVFVCHGLGWMAEPPRLSAIEQVVAVGRATRKRVLQDHGFAADRCVLIPNGVDTNRFRPTGRALALRPRRALVFSNNAAEGGWLEVVRAACALRGIQLDVIGTGVGNGLGAPEEVLGDYDLVFGRGRCAREAIASGCAVVLVDTEGLAGMVCPDDLEAFDRAAFGASVLTRPHEVDAVGAEIDRYDPEVARAVSERLRVEGSLQRMVERLIACYRTAIDAHRSVEADPVADLAWLLDHLRTLSALGLERDEVLLSRHLVHEHALALQARVLTAEPALAEAERARVEAEQARERAEQALAELQATKTVRLRDWVVARTVARRR